MRAIVIFGGNGFTSSVTHLGLAAPETLIGTSAADNIVGGGGDDVLIGNGGADVLLGGQGNDVLAFSRLDFRRIDGGTGNNTLRFDGSDLGLKLRRPSTWCLRNSRPNRLWEQLTSREKT